MPPQKMVPHQREVYDNFSGGDFGVQHPRLAQPGTFHAKNIVVYRDGTIGPRNGLVEVELNGAAYVNGALNSFVWGIAHDAGIQRMYYSQDKKLAFFLADTFAAQAVDNFTGPAATPDPFLFDDSPEGDVVGVLPRLGFNSYYAVLGDGLYQVDALSNEVVKLNTNSLGGHDVIEYLDQLYLVGIGSAADGTGHKIVYSEHADPEVWPVENEFLVGYAWVVFRALKLMNGLLIVAQDSSWYLLQGTVETGSLRRVASGRAPELTNPGSLVSDRERAWFMASGAPGGAFPAVFDGNELDTEQFKHLRGWISGSEHIGATLNDADDDLMFVGDETHRALMRHEGLWTRHEYEVDVSEWVTPYSDQRFFIAVDGTVSTKPTFYRSTFANEGPAIFDGEWESPGDGDPNVPFDAWVEFPELWQPTGEQMRPMTVIVEFTSYDTGSTASNHLAAEVDVIDRFGHESTKTHGAGEWDETAMLASGKLSVESTTDGVRRRHIFREIGAAQEGSALQLRLTDIRGVKIERIVLEYEFAGALDRA